MQLSLYNILIGLALILTGVIGLSTKRHKSHNGTTEGMYRAGSVGLIVGGLLYIFM